MSRKHDRAAELRAIADGRLMLNVRNGVTVSRSMLAMIADEIDALQTTTVTPAEVGGLVERWRRHAENAQRTLNIKASEAAKGHDWVVDTEVFRSQDVIDVATALEAQAAELAALREADGNFWEAIARAERAEAALAEANKALDEIGNGCDGRVNKDALPCRIARRAREAQGGA